ncbi:MAG TPA: D-alanyl-D-alanine endopeptidase [Gammaproteobacteria bacterium]
MALVALGGMLAGAVSTPAFAEKGRASTPVRTANLTKPDLDTPLTELLADPVVQRQLKLQSAAALVLDQASGTPLFAKNADRRMPIASITKLMTAMIVLDGRLPLKERLTITKEDYDRLRGSSSRLRAGMSMTRYEMLHLALMSSENCAASALARNYPGGKPAFVRAMNRKARELGLRNTTYADSTGLHGGNVSTPEDLAKLVRAAHRYDLITKLTTSPSHLLATSKSAQPLVYKNTNVLVRNGDADWDIGLSKTGYLSEAGRCLVMQARISGRPVVIVLLNAQGKYTTIGDANRIKKWIEQAGRKHT